MKNKLQEKIGAIIVKLKSLIVKKFNNLHLFLVSGQFGEDTTTKIDYNFNMENYFELDGKIAENRQRLREQYEMYRKIENYYTIFFVFIGFLGVYYFDFIDVTINNISTNLADILFLLTTSITTIFVVLISIYIIQILSLSEWNSDKLPKDTYDTYFNEMNDWNDKQIKKGKETIDVEVSVKEGYLEALENAVEANQIMYKKKKDLVKKVIQLIIITMFIYSINIIHYKQYSKMCEEEKPKTTVEVTNEGFI